METTSKEFKSDLISEARASLQLAIPLVVSQMCETGVYGVYTIGNKLS